MKVDNSLQPVGNGALSGTTKGRTVATSTPSGAASSSQVQLSSPLSALLDNSPVTDARKIAEIKQAISEGRFKIDPERIADGLLDNVRQMLGRDATA